MKTRMPNNPIYTPMGAGGWVLVVSDGYEICL